MAEWLRQHIYSSYLRLDLKPVTALFLLILYNYNISIDLSTYNHKKNDLLNFFVKIIFKFDFIRSNMHEDTFARRVTFSRGVTFA